jgi:protein TonB
MRAVKVVQSDMANGRLRTPTQIPEKVQIVKSEEAPPDAGLAGGVVGGVVGGVPGGTIGGVLGGIIGSANTAVPKVATPQPQRPIRVSQGVMEGNLVRKVSPTYPPLAKQARISGTVVLQAVISKNGTVENLHVLQGHPMLVPAAMDAVKQWKYKPYLLNGEPVEVDLTITLSFTMGG